MADIEIRNATKFVRSFLDEYLAGGLGRMQKRDIDVLVLDLLIKDGRYKLPDDLYRAARELKMSETRLRNLFQDVQLRYQQLSEDDAKAALVKLVDEGAYEMQGKRFKFEVHDPMVGQYFREWVAGVNGLTDSSFNSNIVSVDREVFLEVLKSISVRDFGKFPKDADEFNKAGSRPAVLRLFVEEFAKSAGNAAGKLSVSVLAGVLAVILGVGG